MSPNFARATVVGDGAMGTLSAILLSLMGTRVTLWGSSRERIAALQKDGENRRYLPGHRIPESVSLVSEAAPAFDSPSVIIWAVPCQFIRSVCERLDSFVPRDVPIVSVAKGMEIETQLLPTGILADCLGPVPLMCLSGPCIAPEVALGKPASVVVACGHLELAERIQAGMSAPHFRIYTTRDLVGVELAAAIKNVIAIAAGICDGIDAGNNAKAALLTRGVVEMSRLGRAMGANAETFHGLAGVGDLFTTCVSKIGRNRTAGEQIGRGIPLSDVIASTPSVIEGIPTTKSVLALAGQHRVEMPIVSAVASVLFDGRSPTDAIDSLMTRQLRSE